MSGAGRKKDDWRVDYKKLKIGGSAEDLPRGGITPIFEDGVLKALVGVGHNGLVLTLQLYNQATAATARTAPPPASADDDELPEEELPEGTAAAHGLHRGSAKTAWVADDGGEGDGDGCVVHAFVAAPTLLGQIAHDDHYIGTGRSSFMPTAHITGGSAFSGDHH